MRPPTERLRPHLEAIEARAAALDESAGFPAEDMALLQDLGLPLAALPRAWGGEGLGTEPAAAMEVLGVLRLLGRANLSVGRLFEAHVNAVRLIIRYGDARHAESVAQAARAGALFGLWVTDAPGQTLRRENGLLVGAKGPGSGAGHLRHALVTVKQRVQQPGRRLHLVRQVRHHHPPGRQSLIERRPTRPELAGSIKQAIRSSSVA